MRRLIIRIAGSNQTFKVKLRPGTTCRDILAQLELPGYVLAPADDPLQEFLPEMDMFRFLEDVVLGSGDL
jgi:hypothetical protein